MKKPHYFCAGVEITPQQAAEIDRRNQEYLDSPLETDWLKIQVVTVAYEEEVKENV